MGAWAGVCIFDFDDYMKRIVPAFRAGESHPMIAQIIAEWQQSVRWNVPDFARLADVIAGADAALTAAGLDDFYVDEGVLYQPSNGDPRPTAKMYDNPNFWEYERLTRLFELVVTSQCVTHYTVFSRSMTSLNIHFFSSDIPWDPLLRELIELLDRRTRYWTHGTGGYLEGINGWLNVEETALLELALDELWDETAPYGITPQMYDWLLHYEGQNFLDHTLRWLHKFYLMVKIAAKFERGLMWGRDLEVFDGFSRYEALVERRRRPMAVFNHLY